MQTLRSLALPLIGGGLLAALLLFRPATQIIDPHDDARTQLTERERYEQLALHYPADTPEGYRARRKLEKLDSEPNPDQRFAHPDEYARILAEMRVPVGKQRHEYKPGYRELEIQKGLRNAQSKVDLPFVNRGPYNVAGRARGLVIDATDATNNTWFVGSVGGGIWKTTDGGATWTDQTPDLPRLPISWIVQAPSDPTVMYAGTGEGFYNVDTINGEGILKSVDGGDSWAPLAPTQGDLSYQNITRVIVDPSDEDIVLASAVVGFYDRDATNESQIFRSTDGGANWATVYNETDTYSNGYVKRITQLIASPHDFNLQLAAVDSKGIMRSTDGGLNWADATTGITDVSGRFEIAFSPSDATRVYAAAEGVAHSELWVSDDGGATWWESTETGTEPNWLGAQGWYDNTIAVHPTNPDIAYVGGIRLWRITLTGGTSRTTSLLSTGPVHVDNHNLVVIDDGGGNWRILNANDGGIGVSGSTDTNWSKPTDGLLTTQFYGADKRPGQDAYAGGMQDNGTWYSPIDASTSDPWAFAIGGDGYEVSWHFNDPLKLIGGYQYNGFTRTLDGGITWESATNGLSDTGGGNAPFISKLAKSNDAPDKLFAVGVSGVWRSEDFGGSWTNIPLSAPAWPAVSSFVDTRFSRADPDVIWAGGRIDASARMHVSTDGGLTFNPTSNYSMLEMGGISGLATHPTEAGTAYVLFSYAQRPKILRTQDYGATWEDISGFIGNTVSSNGFPDVAVYDLLVMPHDTDHIWVGSEIGIIESLDGGATWGLADNGWGSIPIWYLTHVEDEIVLGTHGRGVWSVEIPEMSQGVTFAPLLESATQGPSGGLVIEMTLRSDYDMTEILVNDVVVETLGATSAKLVTSYAWPVVMDQSVTVKLRSYAGGGFVDSIERSLDVYALEPPLFQYANDFDTPSDDFFGSGFSIATPGGFSDPALHSTHFYNNSETLLYTLKQPIVVAPSNALIEFDEIAIVEPGNPGSVYGDSDFWDYVVVEGSSDGTTWLPLVDGYDARSDPAWEQAYNFTNPGNSSMFRQRVINLHDTFSQGQQILVRFRLFADAFVNGWGWAIDNLTIQGGVVDTPSYGIKATLAQNRPNPFNPATEIRFSLPLDMPASLRIYDLRGRLVRTLFDGPQQAGPKRITWDGRDHGGARVASGSYVYRLEAGDDVLQKKMLLLK